MVKKEKNMRFATPCLRFLAVSALLLPGHAFCAEGVQKDLIKLGQTGDLSGSRAANTKEFNAGAVAYFDQVNKQGGVFGRRIELISKDDAYKVDRSLVNLRELIEKDHVFLIWHTVGTENFIAIEQITTPARIPVFAPSSGAEILRSPYKRYVFPVRGGYHAEMEKIVEHLATVGVTRISVFYDDDSFGKDLLVGIERVMARHSLKIHSLAATDREGKQIGDAAKKIGASMPEATIVGSAGSTALRFVQEMLKQGYNMPYYMNSAINVGAFTKELGGNAHGVAVVQMMPALNDASVSVAREYKKVALANPAAPQTPKGLEGFVAAKILVEGLKRAGKDLTREKFVQALESIQTLDLGGISARYSATEHTGITYSDLSVISRDGRALR